MTGRPAQPPAPRGVLITGLYGAGKSAVAADLLGYLGWTGSPA